jgi:hypothetical protein
MPARARHGVGATPRMAAPYVRQHGHAPITPPASTRAHLVGVVDDLAPLVLDVRAHHAPQQLQAAGHTPEQPIHAPQVRGALVAQQADEAAALHLRQLLHLWASWLGGSCAQRQRGRRAWCGGLRRRRGRAHHGVRRGARASTRTSRLAHPRPHKTRAHAHTSCTHTHTDTHRHTHTHTRDRACCWMSSASATCVILGSVDSSRYARTRSASSSSRRSAWQRRGPGVCGVVFAWCGVVWCGVVWCGVVWCGVVWCGVVWCGVVWCGVVWWSDGKLVVCWLRG